MKIFLGMDQVPNQLFSTIKVENNMQIIDINLDINTYDLLSHLFHNETIVVDNATVFSILKNDKKRYFEDTTVCYNCGKIGHTSRDCPTVKERNCMYCSINHKGRRCDLMFCENCLRLGHLYKYCTIKYNPLYCIECKDSTHDRCECPRIWRKYVFKKFVASKNLIMSCPLCYSTSHFLDDCEIKVNNTRSSIFTEEYLSFLPKSKNKPKKVTDKKIFKKKI